jgi:hypothetical protein
MGERDGFGPGVNGYYASLDGEAAFGFGGFSGMAANNGEEQQKGKKKARVQDAPPYIH